MSVYYKDKQYNTYRIGKLLKTERKKQKINLSDLQNQSLIVKSKLSYLENGKIKRPKIAELLQIIKILHLKDEDIFNEYTEEKGMEENKFLFFLTTIRCKLQMHEYEIVRKEITVLEQSLGNVNHYSPYISNLWGDYYYHLKDYIRALSKYQETVEYLDVSKMSISLYYDAHISLNNTLYVLKRTEEAIHKNIQLLQRLTELVENKNNNLYTRQFIIVKFNLALCFINNFEIDMSYELIKSILPLVKSVDRVIEGKIYYLSSILLYYKSDGEACYRSLFKSIQIIKEHNNTELISKAMMAVYIFGLTEPDYFDFPFLKRNGVFNLFHQCDDMCSRNSGFHRACNLIIQNYIKNNKYEEANKFIKQVNDYGHANTMTQFYESILMSLKDKEKASELLEKVMKNIEDKELLPLEKSYIISYYLNSKVTNVTNNNFLNMLHNSIEEVYVENRLTVISELIPDPLH